MEDHFSINVARRVKPDTARFGPYHEHLFRATMPASNTKVEALAVFEDLSRKFPEPDFRVSLSRTIVRSTTVKESGGVPVSSKTEPVA